MAPQSTLKGPYTTVYFNRFPKKVKRFFKAWCDMNGLTLKEGFIKSVEAVTKMEVCKRCKGIGLRRNCKIVKCSACKGSGFKTEQFELR